MVNDMVIVGTHVAIIMSIVTLFGAYRKIVAYKRAIRRMAYALQASSDMMRSCDELIQATLNCNRLGVSCVTSITNPKDPAETNRLIREFLETAHIVVSTHKEKTKYLESKSNMIEAQLAAAKKEMRT